MCRYGTQALTVGAIGGLTLGTMTRTARGHTRRPLVADGFEMTAFLLISADTSRGGGSRLRRNRVAYIAYGECSAIGAAVSCGVWSLRGTVLAGTEAPAAGRQVRMIDRNPFVQPAACSVEDIVCRSINKMCIATSSCSDCGRTAAADSVSLVGDASYPAGEDLVGGAAEIVPSQLCRRPRCL